MLRKKNILKDALRNIYFNKKRFILLVTIISLLTSVLISINSFTQSIKKNINNFYYENNLMDIKISSSVGFLSSDYDILKQITNTKGIMMNKSLDTKAKVNDKDFSIKVISISENRSKKNNDYINRLKLTNGKYPITINEGLVQEDFFKKNNLKLGDLITLEPDNQNILKAKKIKITGTVKSTYYSSSNEKSCYIYILKRNFNYDYYNDIYITINKDNNKNIYSSNYENLLFEYKKNINSTLTPIISERFNEKNKNIKNEIDLLKEQLDNYYTLEYPFESLNDLINKTTNDLEVLNKDLINLKKNKISIQTGYNVLSFYNSKYEISIIKKISNIFSICLLPVLFLIFYTIAKKLVNEEKNQINTLYKIGFSFKEISFKYVFYNFVISILGSLIGSLIFGKLLLTLILFSYNSFYKVPSLTNNINFNYVIFICLICILLSIIATLLALLFSKKTKINKKNISTKFNKLYNNLSINTKIAFKNAFESKKRLILKILLIAFISFNIITLFSLKDSINNSLNKQFKKIFKYDLVITTNNLDNENIDNLLNKNEKIKQIYKTYKTTLKIKNINTDISLIVIDNKNLDNFISLQDNNKTLIINNNGVIISENLSKLLNKKVNDDIKITFDNNIKKNLKISAITKNYINNYVYISRSLYEKLNNNKVTYNCVLIKLKNSSDKNIIKKQLANTSQIKTIDTKDDIIMNYKQKVSPINLFFTLFIILEFILLFIVLYCINLINLIKKEKELKIININEISDKQIIKCINKENFIFNLTGFVIGILFYNILANKISIIPFIFDMNFSLLSFVLIFIIINIIQFIAICITYYNFKNTIINCK